MPVNVSRLPVFNDNLSLIFLQGPAAVTSTSRSVVVAEEGVAVRRATASVATGGTPASIFRTRLTPTAPDTPTRPALTTAKQTGPQLQQLYSTIGRSLVIGLAHQDFWGAQLEILFMHIRTHIQHLHIGFIFTGFRTLLPGIIMGETQGL